MFNALMKLPCSQDVRTVGQRRIGKALVIFQCNVKWLVLVLILPCFERGIDRSASGTVMHPGISMKFESQIGCCPCHDA